MRLIFLDSILQGPVRVTLALMLRYQPSILKVFGLYFLRFYISKLTFNICFAQPFGEAISGLVVGHLQQGG